MATLAGFSWQAGGTIVKYGLLELDGTNPEAELTLAGADTDQVIAVATNDATTTNPSALTYELLQPGQVYSVLASAAITALDNLAPTTGGKVKTAASGDRYFFKALEAASADGDVILAVCVLDSHLLA
jgi:hypothetical protein